MATSEPIPGKTQKPPFGSEVPNWALRYAKAALDCGQKVDQIEAALVGKGLTPECAQSAVYLCVRAPFEAEKQHKRRSFKLRWLNRGASIVVAGVCIIVAMSFGGLTKSMSRGLTLGLACIWFSETMGDRERVSATTGDVQGTPWFFVVIGGWILLLAAPFAWLLIVLRVV